MIFTYNLIKLLYFLSLKSEYNCKIILKIMPPSKLPKYLFFFKYLSLMNSKSKLYILIEAKG